MRLFRADFADLMRWTTQSSFLFYVEHGDAYRQRLCFTLHFISVPLPLSSLFPFHGLHGKFHCSLSIQVSSHMQNVPSFSCSLV
jgi:hypothetical protein